MLHKAQYERLFKSHYRHLVNFSRQYVGHDDSCEDIVQKVFIRLWEKRADIDPDQGVVSYLFTAVRNRSLNHLRDSKKYRNELLDIECAEMDVAFEVDHLAMDELERKIAEALESLPEKCRLVFEMSRFQDMKYREIAEALAISSKTVEAHMSKAIRSLRQHLESYLSIVYLIFLLFM
jgi:RNA polymerase sigma-70 factor (ECF subfamily)